MIRPASDQGSLFGYISPVTGEVSTHPPLCACGVCQCPVERFQPDGGTKRADGETKRPLRETEGR